jgi:hypothetical protein
MDYDVVESVIKIRRGVAFEVSWPLTDKDTGGVPDLTGWSAACEVRTDYDEGIVTRFHSDSTLAWDGSITFDASGNMTLSLPSVKTAALNPLKRGRFDVVCIDPAGEPWLVVMGPAHVTREVTSDA